MAKKTPIPETYGNQKTEYKIGDGFRESGIAHKVASIALPTLGAATEISAALDARTAAANARRAIDDAQAVADAGLPNAKAGGKGTGIG